MLQHSVWPVESLLHEYGSIPVRRDFWLPFPGPVWRVAVPTHGLDETRRALDPPTRRLGSEPSSTLFPPAPADPDWSGPCARLPPAGLAPVSCRWTVALPGSPNGSSTCCPRWAAGGAPPSLQHLHRPPGPPARRSGLYRPLPERRRGVRVPKRPVRSESVG